jgi:hypothetical protein
MENRIDFTGQMQKELEQTGWDEFFKRKVPRWFNAFQPLERLGERTADVVSPGRNLEVAVAQVKSSPGVVKDFINRGIVQVQDGVATDVIEGSVSFKNLFEPVHGNVQKIRDAMNYVVSRRAVGRGLAGFKTPEALREAQATMQYMEQFPEIVEVARRWEEYTEGLGNYAVGKGLWTQQQWEAIRNSDVLYVPFRRVLTPLARSGGTTAGKGFTNISSGVKPYTGSARSVLNPAQALAEYTEAIITRADRYRVGHLLFDYADTEIDDAFSFVRRVEGPDRSAIANQLEIYRQNLEAGGVDIPPEAMRGLDDLYIPDNYFDAKNPLIWRNGPEGTKEWARVTDPVLWEAVRAMRDRMPQSYYNNPIIKSIQALKRAFVGTTTGLSPTFSGYTNPARDVPVAWSQSTAGAGFSEGFRGLGVAAGASLARPSFTAAAGAGAGALAGGYLGQDEQERWTRVFYMALAGAIGAVGATGARKAFQPQLNRAAQRLNEMRTAGLGHVSMFDQPTNAKLIVQQMAPTTTGQKMMGWVRRGLVAPLIPFETLGNISDVATRTPEVLAQLKAKAHKVKSGEWTGAELRAYASMKGRGATIDFQNTPGLLALAVAADLIPFFNPAIQAPARMLKAIRQNPWRMAMYGSAVLGASLFEWALKHQNPEARDAINERSAGERASYFMYSWDKGQSLLRFPISQETGVLRAAVHAALDAIVEDDPQAMELFTEGMLRALPPGIDEWIQLNLTVPIPGVQQLFENAYNRQTFTGSPVEPPSMREWKVPSERRFDTTPITYDVIAKGARVAGERLPLLPKQARRTLGQTSPLQAENVLRGVFSKATPYITAITDIAARMAMGEQAPAELHDPFSSSRANPVSIAVRKGPTYSSVYEEEYFETRKRVAQVRSTFRAIQKAGDEAAYQRLLSESSGYMTDDYQFVIDQVDVELDELRRQQQIVRILSYQEKLTDKETIAELNRIQTRFNWVMRNAVQYFRLIEEGTP